MFEEFDRSRIRFKSLRDRGNRIDAAKDLIHPGDVGKRLSDEAAETAERAVERIRAARRNGRPVILAFGAHTIKNGLGPVLIDLAERGWITHLATNGAGIIHDWELAYQGRTSEDVKINIAKGEFGLWEETNFTLNLAIIVGAYEGRGYGESIGALIHNSGLAIPGAEALTEQIVGAPADSAAASFMLAALGRIAYPSGFHEIKHPFAGTSLQAAAYRLGVPFTAHPMFGHDIIYTHPLCSGGALGLTAEKDFLRFAKSIGDLEGGVYLSIGSAVMSPMIFEKSLSMARNVAQAAGKRIQNFSLFIVDLAESTWNWSIDGEPPSDRPEYYLRYLKTFSRMGGEMSYSRADNRDFLLALSAGLRAQDEG